MKSEGAIRQQLKQVTFRHQKRLLEDLLSKRPCNCRHNQPLEGPEGGDPVYVCLALADEAPFRLCDERFGGLDQAETCPVFASLTSREEIKDQFKEFLESSSLGAIASEYSDIAALIWVLEVSTGATLGALPDSRVELVEAPAKKAPWWARLWGRK